MPRTKSVQKSSRQGKDRQKRLQPFKTHMKTMIRKIADLSKDGKKDEALKLLPTVYKSIDMAAKKRIIHHNTASRRKASVAKLVSVK